MQYDEYEKKAIESIQAFHLPDDYIDRMVRRGEILAHYIQGILGLETLGEDQVSPSGIGYGCHMMWPEFLFTEDEIVDLFMQGIDKGIITTDLLSEHCVHHK